VAALARNASLPGSRTASRRRSTVNGRITRWYSDCLKSPRRISAIDQMNASLVLIASVLTSLAQRPEVISQSATQQQAH